MKKIFKFFATVASFAAVAGGAFLVYKKFFANEADDFDFDDSFADEDNPSASREYVSINITNDETEEETEEETVDASAEESGDTSTEEPAFAESEETVDAE